MTGSCCQEWSGGQESCRKLTNALDKARNQRYNTLCSVREWRNWQTRMIQVHVLVRACRFKSCFPHYSRSGLPGRFFCLELSSQVQQLIEENHKRRSPAEAFARAKKNLVGKGIEERGIKGLQVDRLGAIFADESIGVFIGAPHPGGVWRRNEEGNVIESS